ncbi:hypothetical protein KY285_007752 [Solanum tuberosum]|nr:hypothetical protein KY285_007752 [Solanum tuberosum]
MMTSFLSDLVTSRDGFTIRVRLCRMWDAINPKKNGELISMDMIFIDEKGNLMHGIIRKTQVNKFKDMLSEDVIDSRVNNNTVLSDVVGCLYGIGDIESVGSKWKKRDIHILTDYSAKTKITLWEELGEKFSPYLYNNDAGPYIVIVTSITVKEFRGEVSFSTTYASKIYVNLDIDYIRSLAPKFSTMSTELQVIESSNVNILPIEEEMFLNRMDIKELLEAEWSSELHECIVTVKSKIKELYNYFGKNLSNNETTPKDQGTNGLTKEMNNQVYVDVLLTDFKRS